MNSPEVKEIKKQMIDKDLTVQQIADELGTGKAVISQLIHGHYWYPGHAEKIRVKFGIVIPKRKRIVVSEAA